MALNIPLVNHPTTQTFIKILDLKASQLSLPESPTLMKVAVAAYAVTQMLAQYVGHSLLGGVIYGLASAALAVGSTYVLLRALKQEHKFVRTVTAIAAIGALAALAYVVLHFIVGGALMVLPPPQAEKLTRFLLFPVIVWIVFMYAFFYRHVALRPIPAFVAATLYALVVEIVLSSIAK